MPTLADIAPDVDHLLAYEPEELGLLLLPILLEVEQERRGYSPENIVAHTMGPRAHPSQSATMGGPYPNNRREEIEVAVREAMAWLYPAGLLTPPFMTGDRPLLTRRAHRLCREGDLRRVSAIRRLSKESLHPSIRDDVWPLYLRERYDTAVFEAMKAVEVAVRRASGFSDKDLGVPLMRRAFDKNTGSLADASTDEGEREARAHMFAGVIGSYKNPLSHRHVQLDDPDETTEILLLASHLLRIVDARAAARGGE